MSLSRYMKCILPIWNEGSQAGDSYWYIQHHATDMYIKSSIFCHFQVIHNLFVLPPLVWTSHTAEENWWNLVSPMKSNNLIRKDMDEMNKHKKLALLFSHTHKKKQIIQCGFFRFPSITNNFIQMHFSVFFKSILLKAKNKRKLKTKII